MTTATALQRTRDSWHRVAEHLLAASQYAHTGTIRLRPIAGGFETTRPIPGRGHLSVVGRDLFIRDGNASACIRITTLRDLASFAGVRCGLTASVYPSATAPDPDRLLEVDVAAAQTLSDWFVLGERALRAFVPAEEPVLWPEHFDVSITVDGVNYGVSPGDHDIAQPYLYVGPHGGRPITDEFWNAPFGAYLTEQHVTSAADAVAFFARGRDRAASNESTGSRA